MSVLSSDVKRLIHTLLLTHIYYTTYDTKSNEIHIKIIIRSRKEPMINDKEQICIIFMIYNINDINDEIKRPIRTEELYKSIDDFTNWINTFKMVGDTLDPQHEGKSIDFNIPELNILRNHYKVDGNSEDIDLAILKCIRILYDVIYYMCSEHKNQNFYSGMIKSQKQISQKDIANYFNTNTSTIHYTEDAYISFVFKNNSFSIIDVSEIYCIEERSQCALPA